MTQGVGTNGPFEVIPAKRVNMMIDVNLKGTLNVTRAFLPLMRGETIEDIHKDQRIISKWAQRFGAWHWKRGVHGRIVNIASVAGRVPTQSGCVYCATKHGVVAFSEAIRNEMHLCFGIWTSIVEPFFTLTPMIENNTVDKYKDMIDHETPQSVFNVYSKKAVLQTHERIQQRIMKVAERTPDSVLDCVIHALDGLFPYCAYRPNFVAKAYVMARWLFGIVVGSHGPYFLLDHGS